MAKKIVHISGKRKMASARITITDGNGTIRINNVPVDIFGSDALNMKVKETLLIASDQIDLNKINIDLKVKGGGIMGQSDAICSSIARGLCEWVGGDALLNAYTSYDRTLIAGDHRLTETHKPSQSSKGPRHKRQKSYR
ncbi:MAG: 30S ribosomal protein S9 [Candidatus Altiarchaeales archaeon IMC4]|nr:MAG: 30S ribosomal protein S9 [Candidatus Altiarchaeales archaeon IMC4]